MRIHLVANPTAGRGRARGLVAALVAEIGRRGSTATVHWTTGPGDAGAHVATLDPAALDRLVSVGGDGTLNELVNGRPPPLPWPVALVPLGTANLVARDAGVPLRGDVAALVRTILEGTPWTVDLLETDRGFALANAGVGLDAEVVRAVAEARRGGVGGYLRWIGPIARTFVRYVPPVLEVLVDGRARAKGGGVVVQNTLCYGGLFTLARGARMDDGRLEVTVLRQANRRNYFLMLLGAFLGRLDRDRGVSILAGTRVEVRSATPAAVQIDGDPAGATTLAVRVRPAALTLLRPPPG